MIPRAAILEFANEVVRLFSPEQVILFGSQACGNATADSDVDILILLDHSGRNIDKAIEILRATNYHFPLDLIVRKPHEFHARANAGDYFLKEIDETGEVLFTQHRR